MTQEKDSLLLFVCNDASDTELQSVTTSFIRQSADHGKSPFTDRKYLNAIKQFLLSKPTKESSTVVR